MSTLVKTFSFSLAFVLFIFLPGTSHAQTLELPQSADLLSVKMIPTVPKPFDFVTIDLNSFMTDLNKATISWTSGAVKKTGRGEKHFEFSVGDTGSVTTVNITIQTAEGTTITRSLAIHPGNVDLIWEASTYTPPMYRGKALYTPQSDIKVVAMPNMVDEKGTRLESKNLIYKWKINGKFQESASGFGKNFIFATGPSVLKALSIEVEVSPLSGSTKATGSLSLNEISPMILFYENNPLLGISYEKALPSQFTLSGKEVTLTAVPYFFSTLNKESGVSYSWTLNNSPLAETGSTIVLRMDTEEKGTASVGVEVKNLMKIFQFMRNSLLIDFGGTV